MLEEGEAVGNVSQNLCKYCQEWTYYGLPCVCALQRVLSLCLVVHGGL